MKLKKAKIAKIIREEVRRESENLGIPTRGSCFYYAFVGTLVLNIATRHRWCLQAGTLIYTCNDLPDGQNAVAFVVDEARKIGAEDFEFHAWSARQGDEIADFSIGYIKEWAAVLVPWTRPDPLPFHWAPQRRLWQNGIQYIPDRELTERRNRLAFEDEDNIVWLNVADRVLERLGKNMRKTLSQIWQSRRVQKLSAQQGIRGQLFAQ